jgi:hypothetical protein
VKSIVFQSDNAGCYSSGVLIRFIFHFNDVQRKLNRPVVERWMFNEAQTGKSRLDTHFSYLNIHFKSYIASKNDLTCEDHIFDALQYRDGIAGTTAVLCELLVEEMERPVLSNIQV